MARLSNAWLRAYPLLSAEAPGNTEPPTLNGLVFVDSLADLPDPVGNVITLTTGAYQFIGTVDLAGNRLVLSGNVALFGTSSETTTLTSTGLPTNQWLITTSSSLPMQNIGIANVQKGVRVIGPGNGNIAIDWDAANFLNVPECAWANDITNFICVNSAYLSSAGFSFSGTIGTVGFTGCLFTVPDGLTGITFDV